MLPIRYMSLIICSSCPNSTFVERRLPEKHQRHAKVSLVTISGHEPFRPGSREVLRHPADSLDHVGLGDVRPAAAPFLDELACPWRVEGGAVRKAHGYFQGSLSGNGSDEYGSLRRSRDWWRHFRMWMPFIVGPRVDAHTFLVALPHFLQDILADSVEQVRHLQQTTHGQIVEPVCVAREVYLIMRIA